MTSLVFYEERRLPDKNLFPTPECNNHGIQNIPFCHLPRPSLIAYLVDALFSRLKKLYSYSHSSHHQAIDFTVNQLFIVGRFSCGSVLFRVSCDFLFRSELRCFEKFKAHQKTACEYRGGQEGTRLKFSHFERPIQKVMKKPEIVHISAGSVGFIWKPKLHIAKYMKYSQS
jgi:hypothetical protein